MQLLYFSLRKNLSQAKKSLRYFHSELQSNNLINLKALKRTSFSNEKNLLGTYYEVFKSDSFKQKNILNLFPDSNLIFDQYIKKRNHITKYIEVLSCFYDKLLDSEELEGNDRQFLLQKFSDFSLQKFILNQLLYSNNLYLTTNLLKKVEKVLKIERGQLLHNFI